MSTGPAFKNQLTLLEEGNVAPGQTFERKKRRVNENGEETSSDSSAEEDVEEELIDED